MTAADSDGNTALHVVFLCWGQGRPEEHAAAAKALIEAGADPHVPNAGGDTPLALARAVQGVWRMRGSVETVCRLGS